MAKSRSSRKSKSNGRHEGVGRKLHHVAKGKVVANKVRYRKARVVNPGFNPRASRGTRMVSPFAEHQLRQAHAKASREWNPQHPTVLHIIEISGDYGIEVFDVDLFRDGVEEDLRRLGLRYQGDDRDRRTHNVARRLGRGDSR